MGAGNVCTFGKCEGLFYVDNDFLDVYSKRDEDGEYVSSSLRDIVDDGFEYDDIESQFNRDDFEYRFTEAMRKRFPSFCTVVDKWISRSRRAVLENDLFYVVFEDNQWSLAIELIEKDNEEYTGLRMGLYKKYLDGMQELILDMNGEVGVYAGAWTHGIIKKN